MRMRQFLQLSVLVVFCLPLLARAEEFTVKRVTPVGPTGKSGVTGPVRWSPDGGRIAYFSGAGALLVADTLGESRTIVQFNYFSNKFEWVSDSEILVGLIRDSADGRRQLLCRVYLKNGKVDTIERIATPRGPTAMQNTERIDGPRLTVGGRVYYTKLLGERGQVVFPQYRGKSEIDAALSDDRILRWDFRSDGLYLVKVDLSDSTKLMDKHPGTAMLPPVMNASGAAIAYHNVIRSLTDAWSVFLPTFLDSLPTGADACGFGEPSFDPVNDGEESLWELSCDDGHRVITDHAVFVNYRQKTIRYLDDVMGLRGCHAPRYSPDGSKISVIASGRVYIAYRGN